VRSAGVSRRFPYGFLTYLRFAEVCPLYDSVSMGISGQVSLMVCLFVSRDAGVSRDQVNLVYDTVGKECPRSPINPPP
jgi:hypothetical protein